MKQSHQTYCSAACFTLSSTSFLAIITSVMARKASRPRPSCSQQSDRVGWSEVDTQSFGAAHPGCLLDHQGTPKSHSSPIISYYVCYTDTIYLVSLGTVPIRLSDSSTMIRIMFSFKKYTQFI